MMCSLTCLRLNLSVRGLDVACSLRKSSYRRPGSARCKVSSVQSVGVGSSRPADGLQVSGDRKRSISVPDLLEVVADDLQNLNTNLKSDLCKGFGWSSTLLVPPRGLPDLDAKVLTFCDTPKSSSLVSLLKQQRRIDAWRHSSTTLSGTRVAPSEVPVSTLP